MLILSTLSLFFLLILGEKSVYFHQGEWSTSNSECNSLLVDPVDSSALILLRTRYHTRLVRNSGPGIDGMWQSHMIPLSDFFAACPYTFHANRERLFAVFPRRDFDGDLWSYSVRVLASDSRFGNGTWYHALIREQSHEAKVAARQGRSTAVTEASDGRLIIAFNGVEDANVSVHHDDLFVGHAPAVDPEDWGDLSWNVSRISHDDQSHNNVFLKWALFPAEYNFAPLLLYSDQAGGEGKGEKIHIHWCPDPNFSCLPQTNFSQEQPQTDFFRNLSDPMLATDAQFMHTWHHAASLNGGRIYAMDAVVAQGRLWVIWVDWQPWLPDFQHWIYVAWRHLDLVFSETDVDGGWTVETLLRWRSEEGTLPDGIKAFAVQGRPAVAYGFQNQTGEEQSQRQIIYAIRDPEPAPGCTVWSCSSIAVAQPTTMKVFGVAVAQGRPIIAYGDFPILNNVAAWNSALDGLDDWNKTATLAPTSAPTVAPTSAPSSAPTSEPSASPSVSPTNHPSFSPTLAPSMAPVATTVAPTDTPTAQPSHRPTLSPTLLVSNALAGDVPEPGPASSPDTVVIIVITIFALICVFCIALLGLAVARRRHPRPTPQRSRQPEESADAIRMGTMSSSVLSKSRESHSDYDGDLSLKSEGTYDYAGVSTTSPRAMSSNGYVSPRTLRRTHGGSNDSTSPRHELRGARQHGRSPGRSLATSRDFELERPKPKRAAPSPKTRGSHRSPTKFSPLPIYAEVSVHDVVEPRFLIPSNELELLNELGEGSFGSVYRGRWRGTDVAVKQVLDRSKSARQQLLVELQILQRVRPHQHVVQFMASAYLGATLKSIAPFWCSLFVASDP